MYCVVESIDISPVNRQKPVSNFDAVTYGAAAAADRQVGAASAGVACLEKREWRSRRSVPAS